jgi:hypothetical protein
VLTEWTFHAHPMRCLPARHSLEPAKQLVPGVNREQDVRVGVHPGSWPGQARPRGPKTARLLAEAPLKSGVGEAKVERRRMDRLHTNS